MSGMSRVGRLSGLVALLAVGCGPNDGAGDGGAAGSGGVGGSGGGAGAGGTGGGGIVADAAVSPDGMRPADAALVDAAAGPDLAGAEAGPDSGPPAVRLTPVRTYAFHDVTTLAVGPALPPALSADGKVMAFSQTINAPNRTVVVSVVNADGSGLREVDRYEPRCYCNGNVEVSADGQVVVTSDSIQVRKAGAGTSIFTLDSNEIWDIRLSADGARVFMLVRRDATLFGTSTRIERGVWVINTDGSGLRQVTGAAAMATALGTTPDKIFPMAGCGRSLAVSNDGSRVVFAAAVQVMPGAENVFAVNGDGTGFRKLVEASGGYRLVQEVGLSGDGRTAAYNVFVGPNATELGVIGFDGGGRRKLADTPEAGCQNRLNLTTDGSRLHVSEPGLLYQTDGSGVLALSIAAFRPPGGAPVKDGTPWGRMSADGKRFSMVNQDDKLISQLMVMDLDPSNLGASPSLSDPTFSQATLTPAGLAMATATVRASGAGLQRVGLVFTAGGLRDSIDRGPGVALNDMGKSGDVLSADGVYTGFGFAAFNVPSPGPRTLRFTAESKSGDRRHATVLEASGFSVQ